MRSQHAGPPASSRTARCMQIWNFAWYLVLGFATALDTLGSQAVGCGDKAGLRKWMAAGVLVLSLLTLPMMVRRIRRAQQHTSCWLPAGACTQGRLLMLTATTACARRRPCCGMLGRWLRSCLARPLRCLCWSAATAAG